MGGSESTFEQEDGIENLQAAKDNYIGYSVISVSSLFGLMTKRFASVQVIS